ncbi:hypothetical protein CGRA01v4_04495 [Colletotrichum graminicola]|nr:hypothetical protein CGRA01v4_04495 [Colletotrichum graminicola]
MLLHSTQNNVQAAKSGRTLGRYYNQAVSTKPRKIQTDLFISVRISTPGITSEALASPPTTSRAFPPTIQLAAVTKAPACLGIPFGMAAHAPRRQKRGR